MKIYSEVKKDLFSYKSEKLSAWSIFLIIVLDIFLFFLVFEGINREQSKIVRTSTAYPYQCMNLFNKNDYDYNVIFNRSFSNYSKTSEKCQTIFLKASGVKNDHKIKTVYTNLKKLESHLYELNTRISAVKRKYPRNYDSMADYKRLISQKQSIENTKASLRNLSSFAKVKELIVYKNANKLAIKKDKESHIRWFTLKSYLYMLKFVIPLLLIVMFFYTKNKNFQMKKKQYNNIVLMIASHLMIILLVPFVLGTLGLIYDLIPKKLIANIVEFLVSFGALFLGYYTVIFCSYTFCCRVNLLYSKKR